MSQYPEQQRKPRWWEPLTFIGVLFVQLLILGVASPPDGGDWFHGSALCVCIFDAIVVLATPYEHRTPDYIVAFFAACIFGTPLLRFFELLM